MPLALVIDNGLPTTIVRPFTFPADTATIPVVPVKSVIALSSAAVAESVVPFI